MAWQKIASTFSVKFPLIHTQLEQNNAIRNTRKTPVKKENKLIEHISLDHHGALGHVLWTFLRM